MGNRIFALCTAILYSRMSDRTLIIDWRDGSYGDVGVNTFNQFFEFAEEASLESLRSSASIYPEVWRENMDTSWGELRRNLGAKDSVLSIDVSRLDYEQEVIVFGSYTHEINRMRPLFQGQFEYLANLSISEILQSILRSELKLNSRISETVQRFKSTEFSPKTLGVHVRNTDMKLPVDKLIERTKKRVRKTGTDCIFLATDDQEIIQLFEHTFKRVVTVPKWFPPAGERLHQNWQHCPDRIQNGIEALTDLYLLAECSGLIFSSQSSFGYLASLLSQADRHNLQDINQPDFLTKLKAKLKSKIGR